MEKGFTYRTTSITSQSLNEIEHTFSNGWIRRSFFNAVICESGGQKLEKHWS
jgi:hypothetical protein